MNVHITFLKEMETLAATNYVSRKGNGCIVDIVRNIMEVTAWRQ